MGFKRGGYALNARHSLAFRRGEAIHVRCVDEEGQPLAGRAYVIEFPDGERVRGELDADGWARHEGVRPGECAFRLVENSLEAPPAGAETHWIDVVVKDEEGRPLAGEDYVLGTGDGQVRGGRLDEEGRCLVERLPGGPCFFALKSRAATGGAAAHYIRLAFQDDAGGPLAGVPFELRVGELTFAGETSADGRVIADVPLEHEEGELLIWPDGDRDEEPYAWPLVFADVASESPD